MILPEKGWCSQIFSKTVQRMRFRRNKNGPEKGWNFSSLVVSCYQIAYSRHFRHLFLCTLKLHLKQPLHWRIFPGQIIPLKKKTHIVIFLLKWGLSSPWIPRNSMSVQDVLKVTWCGKSQLSSRSVMKVAYGLVKMITRIVFASHPTKTELKRCTAFSPPKKHRPFWGEKIFLQNLVKILCFSWETFLWPEAEVTWVKCRSAFVLKVAFLTPSVAVCPNAALHLMRRPAMPTRRRWKMVKTLSNCYSFNKKMGVIAFALGSYDLTWLTICIFMVK